MAVDETGPELNRSEFELFRRLIAEQSGIELNESQADSLSVILSLRAREKHFSNYLEYHDFLKQDPQGEELKELLNLITNNETCFFRMPSHFAVMREHILPEIWRRKKDKVINVWSAGCATGEEPYSIAITLKEYFQYRQEWKVRILATDVSEKALSVAEEALYGERRLRLVDPERLAKYFEPQDKRRYKLKSEIRKMVCFGYHNLNKEPFPTLITENWDIIFCRNVAIYFSLESARKVVNNFYESLSEGGYLFVGYAEMLQPMSYRFALIDLGNTFVYKKVEKGELEPVAETNALPAVQMAEVKDMDSEWRKLLPETGESKRDLSYLESEEESLAKAEVFLEQGKYELALPLLKMVLGQNPQNVQALLFRGLVSANLKDYGQAEEDCLRVIRINRMVAPAHFLLAVVYDNQGKTERAIEEFRKTVYLDQEFALAYLYIAHTYERQGREEDAIRESRNAARAARRNPDGEWVKYAGGFLTEAVIDTAEKLAGKLEKSSIG